MTYSYSSVRTFEFTAFTEADLLQGTNGGSIGCGDTFTMPTAATTCFEVADDDRYLSGDACYNESGDDRSHQTANIEVNGETVYDDAKIYAEQYHKLYGSDGKTYYLIEIEVKNGDAPGEGDDFFTFYGAVPPAGVELTVAGSYNVRGDWVDFKCLDAGDKPWVLEDDCTYTLEAEDMQLHGYKAKYEDEASGDALIKLTDSVGYAKADFGGEDGTYNIEVCYVDENDGEGFIDIFINGQFVGCISLDENDNGDGVNHVTFSSYELSGVELSQGDQITLKGRKDGYEFARIDKIVFEQVKDGSVTGTVFCDDDCDGIQDGEVCELGPNLIVNGDFEDNPLNNTGWDQFDSIPGWYAIRGQIEVQESNYGTGNTEGNAVVELDAAGNAIICQQVEVDCAGTYQFSLDYAMRGSDAGTNGFAVFIDGVKQAEVHPTESGWQTLTLEIDLEVGTTRIDLKGLGDSDCIGTVIDNVSLQKKTIIPAEAGKEGVLVTLLDADGNEVLDDMGQAITTVTDANGDYRFDGVPEGDYRVRVEEPDGFDFTLQNVGSDDSVDSDVNGDGVSDVFSVTAGEETRDIDAGLKEEAPQPGALSGTYFCDENRDGDDDGAANGDADVAGRLVTLLNADGAPAVDIDGNAVDPVRTDAEGNYRFDNLAAGDYIVAFEGTDGKSFIAQDAGNDDTDDSDVDPMTGRTAPVTVNAGEETMDVDAGVEAIPGALSGTYFCDVDDDDVDDGAANGDLDVAGRLVTLLDANGDPARDIDGALVAPIETDAEGNYRFDNLAAGDYIVQFESEPGKSFVAQDAGSDDTVDSDVDPMTGRTGPVTVNAGEETMDVDAGVEQDNRDPEPNPDDGMVCSDASVMIDVLANDDDADGDALTITAVDGQAISEGGSVTLASGAVVSLSAGKLVYDLSGDGDLFDDLLVGEEMTDNFAYTVSDGNGGEASSNVDVTVCGAESTLEMINDSLPAQATFTIQITDDGGFQVDVDSTDDRLDTDGFTMDAFCVDFGDLFLIDTPIVANVYGSVDPQPDATPDNVDILPDGVVPQEENLDLVNWILNQDFKNTDNGDGMGENYSGYEIQVAVWFFTNNIDIDFDPSQVTPLEANVQELIDLATANGEDFVAGMSDLTRVNGDVVAAEDQLVGVILDPVGAEQSQQPFIVGVPFNELALDCLCA